MNVKCYYCQSVIKKDLEMCVEENIKRYTNMHNYITPGSNKLPKSIYNNQSCQFCPHAPNIQYEIVLNKTQIVEIKLHGVRLDMHDKKNPFSNIKKDFSFTINITNNNSHILERISHYFDDVGCSVDEKIIAQFNNIPNINPYNIYNKLPLYILFS